MYRSGMALGKERSLEGQHFHIFYNMFVNNIAFVNNMFVNNISGAIRKTAPIIVGSLFVLFFALSLSIVGTTKNDYKTIVSAVIYIFAGQSQIY